MSFDFEKELRTGEYLFPSSMEEIDNLTGKEFETYLFYFFKAHGYIVKTTLPGQDNGLDLTVKVKFTDGAEKVIGLQAKRWSTKVGVDQIRAMLDTKDYYALDYLWIITTSGLTQAAITMAQNNGIAVKDRNWVSDSLNHLKSLKGINFRKKESFIDEEDENKLSYKEEQVYENLRMLRKEISQIEKLPIWMIFSNQTLLDIVKAKPKNDTDLLRISGLGRRKVEKYSELILNCFNIK